VITYDRVVARLAWSGTVIPPAETVKGLVRFEHVDFAYPTRPNNPVLKGQCLGPVPAPPGGHNRTSSRPNPGQGHSLIGVEMAVKVMEESRHPSRQPRLTPPRPPVFPDFTLTLHPGETVAITGPSGCGKSSLALLLTRMYAPRGGSVTLDGYDIASLDTRWLRTTVRGGDPPLGLGSGGEVSVRGSPILEIRGAFA
jgi:ABC-type multidrug transport system fused ATPase/permease subunit